MSIRETVLSAFQQLRSVSKQDPPTLTDGLVLLDSGLDSLGIAIVVTRLEDALGFDPFSDGKTVSPPVTLGEFIQIYENAAKVC
jgi:hypothetical protein